MLKFTTIVQCTLELNSTQHPHKHDITNLLARLLFMCLKHKLKDRQVVFSNSEFTNAICEDGDAALDEHVLLASKYGFSYRTLLGELLYAYVTCRPDIGYWSTSTQDLPRMTL